MSEKNSVLIEFLKAIDVIIFRYLLKEVSKTQLAVFFVLMSIFVSRKFVAVLADASEGGIPGHLVMTFIGLYVPYLTGMILPLSFFLGVLLAYGRIYADNEMVVFHACGISEWYVVRVTLILALVTAIITGFFTFYLTPLVSQYETQIKATIAADTGLSSLVAGRFQKTGNNKAVVFIHEKDRHNNTLQKVFMAQLPDQQSDDKTIINYSIVYAKQGQVIEEDNGAQRLILNDGIRYQSNPNNKEFRSVAFKNYYIQIQDKKVEHQRLKISATKTQNLFGQADPEYLAEFHWRLAFPLTVIMLTLIAVPLSVVNPRQGRFAKLFPALLLFLAYFLLLTSMRSALEKSVVPGYVGLWPVHLTVLGIGISLLLKERTSGRKVKAKLMQMWVKR